MPYLKITQPKLADAIVAELEQMILEGSLQPGQKLPPERELAIQFQVSRPAARSHPAPRGKRTLVSSSGRRHLRTKRLEQRDRRSLFELLSTHPEAQYDLLEFRHALEGICAYYAALRGTDADFERIRQVQSAIEEAGQQGSLVSESAAVTQFYLAVAEASHNVVLLHLLRAMGPMLEQNILRNNEILNRRPGVVAKIRRHRAHLIEAILSGAPERARAACHEHLAFIEDTLLDMQREDSRIQRSMRRIRQQEN